MIPPSTDSKIINLSEEDWGPDPSKTSLQRFEIERVEKSPWREDIINKAINWIKIKQNNNGHTPQRGKYLTFY